MFPFGVTRNEVIIVTVISVLTGVYVFKPFFKTKGIKDVTSVDTVLYNKSEKWTNKSIIDFCFF